MQTVEELLASAKSAAAQFSQMNKDQVEIIATAVGKAAREKSQFYAEWAVRETGFGDVDGKKMKNDLCSLNVVEEQDFDLLAGYKIDTDNKTVRFAKPAGVVVALVPSTNPVATIYFKALATLMTRNSVILCPHPAAKECSTHAADYLAGVAVKMGAPENAVQVVREPSIPFVNALMHSDDTSVILATGGPAMVRAAYSSGNPAIGVGPGNVPCYVDSSADVAKAGAEIVFSKSFDNSLPCACESVVLADEEISNNLKQSMIDAGAQFVAAEDIEKLSDFLFSDGQLNPAALGRSAQTIAESAAITYQEGAKVLVVELDEISATNPYNKEKMCPVVGFHKVDGVEGGVEAALEMLNIMGAGHSAVVHAQDYRVTSRYASALPVCRVSANTPAVTGASGMSSNLDTGPVIGTGYYGRSSVSENIGPKQLVQHTVLAYSSDPSEVMNVV